MHTQYNKLQDDSEISIKTKQVNYSKKQMNNQALKKFRINP